jgi:hypothetical protein
VDDTNTDFMTLAASISKTTGAWAVGTGNGALDTGAIANKTWYHVFEIKRPDTAVVDVLISASVSAPTMATNYTLKRRIGSIKTNGSAQWIKFVQLGDEFLWDTIIGDVAAADPTTTGTLFVLSVPSGVQVNALVSVLFFKTSAGSYLQITSPDQANVATVAGNAALYSVDSTHPGSALWSFRTDTSSQIRARCDGAGANSFYLNTRGWIDRRGRDA